MITETITELPIAPSTSDPVNFRSRADLFLASLNTFDNEMNTVISEINSTAQTINSAETSAVQAKDVAVASANFIGTWSSDTAYTIGQSVAHNGNVYRAILASTNQTPTNTTYWVLLTGIKTVNGLSPDASGNINIEAKKGANIASASTITIGTAGLGDTIHITGTTTITSLGNATSGIIRTLIFDGALTLTHNGTSLILPDATNITTAVGDSAEFVCDTTNNWKCLRYTRSTTKVASETEKGIIELATNAEVQTGTDTSRAVTPAGMKAGLNASGTAPIYACRAWVNFNGTGTVAIRASGNVSSIADNGTGDYTVNFTTAMSDVNYSANISDAWGTTAEDRQSLAQIHTQATSSLRIVNVWLPSGSGATLYDISTICATIVR